MNKFLIFVSLLLGGCATFDTPVKTIAQDETACVYIANLGEILSTYAVYNRQADYGGTIGYQNAEIGGNTEIKKEFIALQDRLGQQAATINNVVKSIVVMHNKNCEQYNTDRAWDSMDKLIKGLEKVYGKVFIKYGASENRVAPVVVD